MSREFGRQNVEEDFTGLLFDLSAAPLCIGFVRRTRQIAIVPVSVKSQSGRLARLERVCREVKSVEESWHVRRGIYLVRLTGNVRNRGCVVLRYRS